MTCEAAALLLPLHFQLLLLGARRGAVCREIASWSRSRPLSPILAMNGYPLQSHQLLNAPIFASHPSTNQLQPGSFASSSNIASCHSYPFPTNACQPTRSNGIVVPDSWDNNKTLSPPLPINRQLLQSALLYSLCNPRQQQLLRQYVSLAANNAQIDSGQLNYGPLTADIAKAAVESDKTPPRPTVNMQQHARGTKRPMQDWVAGGPFQKQSRSDIPGLLQQHSARHIYTAAPNSGSVLTPKVYDQISEVICKFHSRVHQSKDLYLSKMSLRDALYAIMKDVFPYCGLYVVGSSMNGFGSNTSDMDLCLMLCHSQIDQKREATEILSILYKALLKCLFLNKVHLIRAKVPILKFIDTVSNVECDLNVNNSVGIRNTHLLNAYSKMDVRLTPLVVFAKHWAKTQNINEAKDGTISSYSLVLMIIHFLQCGSNPPVLSSLQKEYPERFSLAKDIRLLSLNETLPPYTSRNTQSVGELFVDFLRYYSHEFDFENLGMSIRRGCVMARYVMSRQDTHNNPPGQWKCLCIEEPFDLSNTARSVYNDYVFLRIQRVFRRSYDLMIQTGNVQAILQQPL